MDALRGSLRPIQVEALATHIILWRHQVATLILGQILKVICGYLVGHGKWATEDL